MYFEVHKSRKTNTWTHSWDSTGILGGQAWLVTPVLEGTHHTIPSRQHSDGDMKREQNCSVEDDFLLTA